MLWSLTGYDWRKRITAEKITEKGANAKAGDVFLLHDGSHLEPAADRSRSIAATEAHLAHYTAEGYRFVTIPELAAAGSDLGDRLDRRRLGLAGPQRPPVPVPGAGGLRRARSPSSGSRRG